VDRTTDNKFDEIRLLTLAEAAGLLQVSIRTLQRMIRSKKVPAFKVGSQWRIRASQLQQWIEHKESSAADQDSSEIV
jgi:excisionase family DNA binding protein